MGGTASQIYDSVTIVPLETTKESEFNVISDLYVANSCYIIYDYFRQNILIFNKEGKFQCKIDKIPLGKTIKHYYITGFTVDRAKKEIITRGDFRKSGMSGPTQYIFDFKGNLLRQESKPFFYSRPVSVGENKMLYAAAPLDTIKGKYFNYLLLVKNNRHLYKRMLPYNPQPFLKNREMLRSGNLNSNYDNALFHKHYSNTLYEVDSTGIKNIYPIIFPMKYSLPADFATDSLYNTQAAVNEFLEYEHPYFIFDLENTYRIDDKLLFRTISYALMHHQIKDYDFLYSLSKDVLYSLDRIEPDSLCYYLPISGSNCKVLARDSKHIYMSLPAVDVFNSREANSKRHPEYSPVLQNYFNNQNRKGNPVIVQLKFKENL